MTAREAAAKFGVHPRTIRHIVAEPRDDYLARAKARRERVVELRAQGLKHREIATELGIPIGTVGYVLHQAKKLAEAQELEERPQAS
jgi:transposase